MNFNSEKARELKDKAQQVKLFITDVDGVLTDGKIILGNEGLEFKAFHVHDGQGIKLAQEVGMEVAIITGRESEAVSCRAAELGISEIYQGVSDKVEVFEQLLADYNLSSAEVSYIGDDLGDLALLKRVGLALTVSNGVAAIKEVADYITTKPGGAGAVREAIQLILALQEL